MKRRIGGSQSLYGLLETRKNSCPCRDSNPGSSNPYTKKKEEHYKPYTTLSYIKKKQLHVSVNICSQAGSSSGWIQNLEQHYTIQYNCGDEISFYINVKGKGKAVPLQAWSGPEGSRKLRFPYYMTTAQDGGKVVNLTHRPPLPPGNAPGTHFC
jgi:hypothetical protein